MPFGDQNTLLTTKPYNVDITLTCNSESHEQHNFLGPSLEWSESYLRLEIFLTRETGVRKNGWTLS